MRLHLHLDVLPPACPALEGICCGGCADVVEDGHGDYGGDQGNDWYSEQDNQIGDGVVADLCTGQDALVLPDSIKKKERKGKIATGLGVGWPWGSLTGLILLTTNETALATITTTLPATIASFGRRSNLAGHRGSKKSSGRWVASYTATAWAEIPMTVIAAAKARTERPSLRFSAS